MKRAASRGLSGKGIHMAEAVGPDLPRQLRLFPATNIVVADMIGAGIFTTSGLLLAELGSPLLMIGLWVAGGLLALSGALCYGVLGAAIPRAGGEYAYLSQLFHPVLGFLSGWLSFFVGFSAPLAASSLGFSHYLLGTFPGLTGGPSSALVAKGIAVTVILILAAVHLRGMAFGARIQNYLTVAKVLLIAGLVIAGFAVGEGSLAEFRQRLAVPSADAGWRTIGLSLMWIMFAYSGWNASGYIGSEIAEPRRNLPRSLLFGTGIVILLYVSLNALFVYAAPMQEMEGVIAVGSVAAAHLFGPVAESLTSALIAFALISAISSLIILGPRVYYAMARDGYFFEAVATVHPERRVPSTAIVLQCLIAILLVLSGTFDQILTYMGFCIGIFPILAVLGVFRLRNPVDGIRWTWWYGAAAVVFATVSLGILVLAYLERPVESSIAVLTVVLGLPVYVVFARSRRRRAALAAPGVHEGRSP
jgi:APA family basic amino acid/polyamine antiporter